MRHTQVVLGFLRRGRGSKGASNLGGSAAAAAPEVTPDMVGVICFHRAQVAATLFLGSCTATPMPA